MDRIPNEAFTIQERFKLFRIHQREYRQVIKTEKGVMLDHLQVATGLHSNSLKRLLNGPLSRKERKKERGAQYGPEVDMAWESSWLLIGRKTN